MPMELKEKLRNVKENRALVTEFAQLPTYVRTACAMHELMGMTWEEVGKRLGKKPATISHYVQYPAYKKWRDELHSISEDPQKMAEFAIRSNLMGITLDYLAAFQAAVDAGSYRDVAKMAQDLLDRGGVVTKKPDSGPTTVVVNLGSTSFEIPLGDSNVKEAEFEIIEPPKNE